MITVKDIFRHGEDYLDKEIELFGWVKKIRDQKKFGFIELNDGSFFTQFCIVIYFCYYIFHFHFLYLTIKIFLLFKKL